MRELTAILDAWRANRQAPGVLATVVHVEGSAYRRPGARMLIPLAGDRIGTISGGCLEGDVAKKAAWWTAAGDPVLRVYDTTSDDDAVWEFGLGCNGVIHVLLERVESLSTQTLLACIDAGQLARRHLVVGTVVRATVDSHLRVGDHIHGDGAFTVALAATARETLSTRRSRLLHLPQADIFVEYVGPPQRLVIFGAGHDVVPVAALGHSLGWDVTVADVRSAYLKPERFPGASSIVQLPPNGDAAAIAIDRDTAVIVMTHNLPLDIRLLPQIVKANPVYLGILGPRHRMTKLAAASALNVSQIDIHSPAGLDLGGDAPESIALSIIAEIQAHLNQRSGGSLRWTAGSIHAPAQEVGQVASVFDSPECSTPVCETTYV